MFISSHPLTKPLMNPWEINALEHNFPDDDTTPVSSSNAVSAAHALDPEDTTHDPILYPGIYAPSGFDMMNILIRVMMRPSPVVQLGPVDASCALLMCDIEQPDYPIVYANEPCTELTGYSLDEMVGKNCRFMQAPDGRVRKSSARRYVDKSTLKTMRRAIESNQELAVEVTNFKKSGQGYTNLLTMIPVCWDSPTPRYYIGFMAEKTW
ncbi:vivid PAS protein VVD [Xylariaceae sp. FL1651]|nr:vivid PAS protein VVD [Xylariaceae sp. FL1651]